MNNSFRSRSIVSTRIFLFFTGVLWLGAIVVQADPRYVVEPGTPGGTDTGPFNTWAIAATQIQWAVDVAVDGETVWVSNGTYYLTNQISITNSITLQSFSGYYTNTVINGNYPAYTNRVVYVANTGAILSGFTITNGCTTNPNGGGFWAAPCKLITNCLITGNKISNNTTAVWGGGGDLTTGTVSHCIFRGNKALLSAAYTAGLRIQYGIASNCVISGNQAWNIISYGALGPGKSSTVANCVISDNAGIGVRLENPSANLYSSTVSNNTGYGIHFGQGGAVKNCLVVGNGNYGVMFDQWGGSPQTIDNCTIANNAGTGVRVYWNPSTKYWAANSIVYYNGSGGTNNWGFTGTNITYTNCCIIPMPTNVPGQPEGVGNITNPPLFANTNSGNYRLSADSPCVNRGTNREWMTNSFDLDGRTRIRYGRVDMGAYETIYNGTIFTIP